MSEQGTELKTMLERLLEHSATSKFKVKFSKKLSERGMNDFPKNQRS